MSTQTSLPRVITLRSIVPVVPAPRATSGFRDRAQALVVMLISAIVIVAPLAPPFLRHAPRVIAAALMVLAARGLFAHMDGRIARPRAVSAALAALGVVGLDVLATWMLGGAS